MTIVIIGCKLVVHLCFLLLDLVEIKRAFLDRYHKTLYKMVEGDTSVDTVFITCFLCCVAL